MKLVSFRAADRDRIGVVLEGGDLIDLAEALRLSGVPEATVPRTMLQLPPVRRPSKICCVALNNSANSDRILRGPKHPAMFTKPASALVGNPPAGAQYKTSISTVSAVPSRS